MFCSLVVSVANQVQSAGVLDSAVNFFLFCLLKITGSSVFAAGDGSLTTVSFQVHVLYIDAIQDI